MRRDWSMRARDVLEAVEKIISHTGNLDYEKFKNDAWMVDATLRNLTVIGEAAAHIPQEVIEKHPEIPWVDMRDMRNIVVHEYFGVDLAIVWKTVKEDLPPLLPVLKRLTDSQD